METDLTIQLKILSSGVEKITGTSGAVITMDNKIRDLTNRLAIYNQRLKEANSNVNTKKSTLMALENNIDKTKNKINELNNSFQSSSQKISNFGKKLESTGSRINVLGQRMTWMVTAPLALFAKKSIDTALEVETSWVRFRKVFSGTEEDFNMLKQAASDLAIKFGRPIEEINNIMAEFNKAGVENADELKKLGEIVSQTAIIFDTDLGTALDGTKSIMMGFNLTADETNKALAALNIIADKTTASETGILEVFNRAAGTARQAGLSFQELAASQAAFEKNAIPAGRAGNAMKSILVSLTKQSNIAKDQFRELGLDMDSTQWRTAQAGDKLKTLAQKMLEVKTSQDKLKIADLNEALASLVGKFQVNNLNVLLEDLSYNFDENADTVSQFYEGIRVSSDETDNLKWQLQQVNKVLESNPQKIASLNEKYRLQAAILGNELIPYKIKLLEFLTGLIEKFNNLSPTTQKWILLIAGLVAGLGPLLSMVGLTLTGLGFFLSATASINTALLYLSGGVAGLATVLGGALLIALAAVAAHLITKAVISFNDFQKELQSLKTVVQENADRLARLQKKIDELPEGEYKEKIKGMKEAAEKHNDELKTMIERYEGVQGTINAVIDQSKDWINSFIDWATKTESWFGKVADAANTAWEKIKKAMKAREEYKSGGGGGGGGGGSFASGGIIKPIYAAQGFFPKGNDTVPAMLSPGEMVLNQGQQANLFSILSGKSQLAGDGGPNVNINVGTMVASRGEQREFARRIKELLKENDNRY